MRDPDRNLLEQALSEARRGLLIERDLHLDAVDRIEAALGITPTRRFKLDRLVQVKVVAKQLGRSSETIRKLCRDEGLGQEIGGTWFIDLDRLAEYINRDASSQHSRKAATFVRT